MEGPNQQEVFDDKFEPANVEAPEGFGLNCKGNEQHRITKKAIGLYLSMTPWLLPSSQDETAAATATTAASNWSNLKWLQ